MPVAHVSIHLPDELWRALQALAPHDGDATTVILRALEECITATGKRLDAQGTVRAGSGAIPRLGTHGPR